MEAFPDALLRGIKLEDCPTLQELKVTLEEKTAHETKLARNRQSAKISRERQKQRLLYLSDRCHSLEVKIRDLTVRNQLLYADNVMMHKRIHEATSAK
jgi:hypothetical protein